MASETVSPGEIEIELGGETVVLRPTLGCAVRLNKKFGSFGKLLAELEAYNLEAAIETVATGAPGTPDVRERVFETGLVTLTPSLIRFVIILANGGKPVDTSTEEEANDHPGPFGE